MGNKLVKGMAKNNSKNNNNNITKNIIELKELDCFLFYPCYGNDTGRVTSGTNTFAPKCVQCFNETRRQLQRRPLSSAMTWARVSDVVGRVVVT